MKLVYGFSVGLGKFARDRKDEGLLFDFLELTGDFVLFGQNLIALFEKLLTVVVYLLLYGIDLAPAQHDFTLEKRDFLLKQVQFWHLKSFLRNV